MADSPLNRFLKYGCSTSELQDFCRECIRPPEVASFTRMLDNIHTRSLAHVKSFKYYTFSVKDKAVTMNVCARGGDRDPTIGQIYFTRTTITLAGIPMDFLDLKGGGPVSL